MLRMDYKNMNCNGSCVVDEDVVTTFSLGYNGGKEVYVNMNVSDYVLFAAHRDVIEADLKNFIDEALEAVLAMNGAN